MEEGEVDGLGGKNGVEFGLVNEEESVKEAIEETICREDDDDNRFAERSFSLLMMIGHYLPRRMILLSSRTHLWFSIGSVSATSVDYLCSLSVYIVFVFLPWAFF